MTKPSRLYSPIGKRREFSIATQVEIIRRATDPDGRTCCEKCGAWMKSRKDYEIDHVLCEGIRSAADKRRKLTPADGQLLCAAICHKSKTRYDKGVISEAARRAAYGMHAESPGKVKIRQAEKKPKKPLKIASGPTGLARRFK